MSHSLVANLPLGGSPGFSTERVQSPASPSWAVSPLSPQDQEKGRPSLRLSVTHTPPQCGRDQAGSLSQLGLMLLPYQ